MLWNIKQIGQKGNGILVEHGDLVVVLQACTDGRDGLHTVHLVGSTQMTIHERTVRGTVRLDGKVVRHCGDRLEVVDHRWDILFDKPAHAAHMLFLLRALVNSPSV